jgi:hypothetical protein
MHGKLLKLPHKIYEIVATKIINEFEVLDEVVCISKVKTKINVLAN